MLKEEVLQRVEDEVTAVSLRNQFGFLSTDQVRNIYFSCLIHVHAEYSACVRKQVPNPVILVFIRKRDVESGFTVGHKQHKGVPQIIGVDPEEACGVIERVSEGGGERFRTTPLQPGMFRVVIFLEFQAEFYTLQIPLPPSRALR
jgi:hypothetical protein